MLRYIQYRKEPKTLPWLPDPNAEKTPDAAAVTASINAAVTDELSLTSGADDNGAFKVDRLNRKRPRTYSNYDEETRAKIGRYAVENGNTKAVRHFTKTLGRPINESTVRGMKTAYVKAKRSAAVDVIRTLPRHPRGHLPMLGRYDNELLDFVNKIRNNGAVINRKILMASAMGLLLRKDRSMLQQYGGTVSLTRGWAQSFLSRHGYVKRKGTKAARKIPENFPQLKAEYLDRISNAVRDNNIPDELIVNFDQTGVKIIPTSDWTLEKEGAKQVPIIGLEDKRQLTAVLACAMSGVMLPPQLLYKGKTEKSHPRFNFPAEWDVWHSENHWSNESTMCRYVDEVIAPYLNTTRARLELAPDHPAVVILDVFRAHRCDSVLDKLRENHVKTVFVPASCTGELQPLDLTVNAQFKQHLSDCFIEWYAEDVGSSDDGILAVVDLRLQRMKPLHAGWLLKSFDAVRNEEALIRQGFEKAGIFAAIHP